MCCIGESLQAQCTHGDIQNRGHFVSLHDKRIQTSWSGDKMLSPKQKKNAKKNQIQHVHLCLPSFTLSCILIYMQPSCSQIDPMQMELFSCIVQNTGKCWRVTICRQETIYSNLQHKLYICLYNYDGWRARFMGWLVDIRVENTVDVNTADVNTSSAAKRRLLSSTSWRNMLLVWDIYRTKTQTSGYTAWILTGVPFILQFCTQVYYTQLIVK